MNDCCSKVEFIPDYVEMEKTEMLKSVDITAFFESGTSGINE